MVDDEAAGRAEAFGARAATVAVTGDDEQLRALRGGHNFPFDAAGVVIRFVLEGVATGMLRDNMSESDRLHCLDRIDHPLAHAASAIVTGRLSCSDAMPTEAEQWGGVPAVTRFNSGHDA
ncbi:hypothetical protein [Streptomyces umbrinus]|uniref:hypothetical protein n=1 Tax=Streptomyces umbrinus TaxID=67370 RepID=UPI003F4D35C5